MMVLVWCPPPLGCSSVDLRVDLGWMAPTGLKLVKLSLDHMLLATDQFQSQLNVLLQLVQG